MGKFDRRGVLAVTIGALAIAPWIGCNAVLGELKDRSTAPDGGANVATSSGGDGSGSSSGGSSGSSGGSASSSGGSSSGSSSGSSAADSGDAGDGGCNALMLASDPANCGACGHSCGGGLCQSSRCQPATLASGLDAPMGFAIDSTSLYFSVDGSVETCPLAGCQYGMTPIVQGYAAVYQVAVTANALAFVTSEPHRPPEFGGSTYELYACSKGPCANPSPLESNNGAPFGGLVATSTDVFFQASPGLCAVGTSCSYGWQCPGLTPTGCSGDAGAIQLGTFVESPIAADNTNMYFLFNPQPDASFATYVLASCPNGAACGAPTVISNDIGVPDNLVANSGALYVLEPQHVEAAPGGGGRLVLPVISSCSTTNCFSSAAFASVGPSITAFTVDSSGLYFAAGANVYECPPSGCGQDPIPIATGQASPQFIATDDRFVYWTTADVTDLDGGPEVGTAAILRVAK